MSRCEEHEDHDEEELHFEAARYKICLQVQGPGRQVDCEKLFLKKIRSFNTNLFEDKKIKRGNIIKFRRS